MMFHVRPDSGEPIYRQLIRQVTHAITTGALRPGDRLPTIRDLAAQQVVNPNTVARAYRELEREGLVESGPRRGTFVTFNPPKLLAKERRARLKPHVDGLVAEARLLGFTPDEVIEFVEEGFGDVMSDASGAGDRRASGEDEE